MKVCLAGEGGMGLTHMQVLSKLEGVEVVSLAGGIEQDARAFAEQWKIPHWSLDLQACLRQPGVEAVILATPTGLHAEQAIVAMEMGKHVLLEIPMALSLADAERVVQTQRKTGMTCMVCHSRRFSPAHRELHRQIREGRFRLYHLVVETYFMRRTDLNMFGKPRTWRDHLLWHHACHSVDLAAWMLGFPRFEVWGQRGPDHPKLAIPMDMSVAMRSQDGVLVTMALSFNNRGPFGAFYRYIGEEETYHVFRDELADGDRKVVALQQPGAFEAQDREFFAALKGAREPEASVASCLPAMALLDRIEACFAPG